ncbi:General stress protein 16O [Roseimaritima multifibrata]|uniref:General stress protein 16O n=1 Tax=Roseimaritima multifibrata TaxID=1930274 RepID=A0A517MK71_9BACT|nr:TraR/DksA C4-type zinc finger protein [Roseimaritima multifibrata]QDS95240.1 General stress protein 16O [Roseimaritima multifibrata]
MPKKKERDYRPFEQMLRSLRTRFRDDVQSMSDAALHSSEDSSAEASRAPNHLADIGSDAFDQEFTLSLVENEEETLQQIEAALERLALGQYGTCADCGKLIPKERLAAIPFTAHCVRCASKLQHPS